MVCSVHAPGGPRASCHMFRVLKPNLLPLVETYILARSIGGRRDRGRIAAKSSGDTEQCNGNQWGSHGYLH
jgi:hypothetical protein